MKTSYKLLSIYLDRKPIPLKKPNLYSKKKEDFLQDIGSDFNLFDTDFFIRKVDCSKHENINILLCKRILQLENMLKATFPSKNFSFAVEENNFKTIESIFNFL